MKKNFPRGQKRKGHKKVVYFKMRKAENLEHCWVMASDKITEIFLEF